MKKVIRIIGFILVLVACLGVIPVTPALAQDGITLIATFPRVESLTPESGFKFTVDLSYQGTQVRAFNLNTVGPSGWTTRITSYDGNTNISAITLDPAKPYFNQIKVITSPPLSVVPRPGEYKISVTAISGNISGNIELTAVVRATYSLVINTVPGRYDSEVTAGKDNNLAIELKNTGSGGVTNIKLTAENPGGWVINFEPGTINSLAPGASTEIKVTIRPPSSAARNYYQVNFIVEASETRATMNIGLQVSRPSGTWIWVGGAIAFLVVVGFVIVFLRLNRGK
jgi:uncharacterized membrane protein